ncbi:guanylyl cyclase [Chloropicon primus]|uniref:Guanylyl cyclase n=1 Tax=Chloropicon primus TaxID=1764295 RepID=A0A5B8MPP9_9CHLO|nr:guanylyl cyclase [Chloropicon primus]UPR01872.1 guanylyl cyclase [Chloropicon primus]|eukprot:QDZ22648.1 guanylyl cyclase [Chloropicon primus]
MTELSERRRGSEEPASSTTESEGVDVCVKKAVPHVRQAFNWDCGIACVLMIVQANGLKHVDLGYLRDVCGTTSIWTIDIAHLLRHFGLKVKYFTVTLGANPAYADEKFYKDHMHVDEVRVHQLFDLAKDAGIEVFHKSLQLEELGRICASPENLVLILVDKRVLQQGNQRVAASQNTKAAGVTKHAKAASLLCCGMLGSLTRSGYIGHYVVLYDYSAETKEYWVKDPASYNSITIVKEATLEKARKSFGTDEDLIIVPFSRAGGG